MLITPMIAKACSGGTFFGLPHWWQYLKTTANSDGTCNISFTFPGGIFLVALAVIQILLFVAGMAAVISIIIAGFEYVGSIGNADKISGARKRIQNSLIGLAICLASIALVAFIGGQLG